MARTDIEQKTISYYDQNAATWSATHGGSEEESYWKSEMDKFHELLPIGKVLEIGSGGGKDAKALIKLYEYAGTDASKGLIEIAQKRNPEGRFINVAVEKLDFPEGSFDGFWASAVLLHIPKERIDIALQRIKKQIRGGGVGFISLKEGVGEKEDPETGRWFSYYKMDEFKGILNKNGFEIIKTDERKEEKGARPNWLLFYVRA